MYIAQQTQQEHMLSPQGEMTIGDMADFLKNIFEPKCAFIIGCGRSGTNWLGGILKESSETYVTIEFPFIFNFVSKLALNQYSIDKNIFVLSLLYRMIGVAVIPRIYVDKSHPNIWFANNIYKYLSKSKYIGIHRKPHPTVSSMMKHDYIVSIIQNWMSYPIPNPFLGITKANAEMYSNLSLAGRCTMKWISHFTKLESLKHELGQNLHLISYEKLTQETETELAHLTAFLRLRKPLPFPRVLSDSSNRWKSELTSRDVTQIDETLAASGLESEVSGVQGGGI